MIFEINPMGSVKKEIEIVNAANCNRPGGFLWGSNGKSNCRC